MTPLWISLGVVAAVGVAVLLYLRRPASRPVRFASEREERLTFAVADAVGCPTRVALDAVRHEMQLSPGQSDAVLTKRAVYHTRQAIPERRCSTYRDSAPG